MCETILFEQNSEDYCFESMHRRHYKRLIIAFTSALMSDKVTDVCSQRALKALNVVDVEQ